MNKEQKKSYLAPELKEIKLKNQANLLQASYAGPLSGLDSPSDKTDMA